MNARIRRPAGWVVVCAAAVAVGYGFAADPPKPAGPKLTVMQRKLLHAQKVLDGLTTGDFDKVRAGADDLRVAAGEASWRVLKTPKYELYSNDFLRNLEALQKAAKNKSVDAAALAYVDLTLTCVKCHQYVREEKMSAAPQLDPARLVAAR